MGVLRGRGFSERSASPPRPLSPEEQRGIRLDSSSKLAPPVRWTRVPAAWLWSRRLTEPPRPAKWRGRWGIGSTLPPNLRPPASWARVPAAWLWSRWLTEPPRPCSVREPGGSKWAVWEAFCGMQGRFRTFSFILTWQNQKSTHFITQKEKVGAFFFPVHGIRRSPLYIHALYKCIRLPCTSAYLLFIYTHHIHRPKRRKSAAALSAAVDTRNMQETTSNLQAEPSQQHCTRQTPAALRKRGSGGEALL